MSNREWRECKNKTCRSPAHSRQGSSNDFQNVCGRNTSQLQKEQYEDCSMVSITDKQISENSSKTQRSTDKLLRCPSKTRKSAESISIKELTVEKSDLGLNSKSKSKAEIPLCLQGVGCNKVSVMTVGAAEGCNFCEKKTDECRTCSRAFKRDEDVGECDECIKLDKTVGDLKCLFNSENDFERQQKEEEDGTCAYSSFYSKDKCNKSLSSTPYSSCPKVYYSNSKISEFKTDSNICSPCCKEVKSRHKCSINTINKNDEDCNTDFESYSKCESFLENNNFEKSNYGKTNISCQKDAECSKKSILKEDCCAFRNEFQDESKIINSGKTSKIEIKNKYNYNKIGNNCKESGCKIENKQSVTSIRYFNNNFTFTENDENILSIEPLPRKALITCEKSVGSLKVTVDASTNYDCNDFNFEPINGNLRKRQNNEEKIMLNAQDYKNRVILGARRIEQDEENIIDPTKEHQHILRRKRNDDDEKYYIYHKKEVPDINLNNSPRYTNTKSRGNQNDNSENNNYSQKSTYDKSKQSESNSYNMEEKDCDYNYQNFYRDLAAHSTTQNNYNSEKYNPNIYPTTSGQGYYKTQGYNSNISPTTSRHRYYKTQDHNSNIYPTTSGNEYYKTQDCTSNISTTTSRPNSYNLQDNNYVYPTSKQKYYNTQNYNPNRFTPKEYYYSNSSPQSTRGGNSDMYEQRNLNTIKSRHCSENIPSGMTERSTRSNASNRNDPIRIYSNCVDNTQRNRFGPEMIKIQYSKRQSVLQDDDDELIATENFDDDYCNGNNVDALVGNILQTQSQRTGYSNPYIGRQRNINRAYTDNVGSYRHYSTANSQTYQNPKNLNILRSIQKEYELPNGRKVLKTEITTELNESDKNTRLRGCYQQNYDDESDFCSGSFGNFYTQSNSRFDNYGGNRRGIENPYNGHPSSLYGNLYDSRSFQNVETPMRQNMSRASGVPVRNELDNLRVAPAKKRKETDYYY